MARPGSGSGCTFHCAPGDAHAVRGRHVDVVVLNHIYEHVVDPDAVLREIRRVLRGRCGLPRAGQPPRRGRAALPAAVPVLAAARPAGRPLRAGLRPGRPLLRAVPHPPRAAPAGRRRSTAGTTPCRCSPTRPAFNGGDVVPGRRRAAARPGCCRRCCRWCRRTSGWGSGRRALPPGRPWPPGRGASDRPSPLRRTTASGAPGGTRPRPAALRGGGAARARGQAPYGSGAEVLGWLWTKALTTAPEMSPHSWR